MRHDVREEVGKGRGEGDEVRDDVREEVGRGRGEGGDEVRDNVMGR